MKISKFLASFFVLVTNTVFANDTYQTQIESFNRVGRSVNWDIELTLNQKELNEISGTLRVWGAGPCNGYQAIKGTLLNNNLEFKVSDHEVKGCGKNTFHGKFEPNTITGKLFFNGIFHDVVFKKK